MTRNEALSQWHEQTLRGFLAEIDHLVQDPAKYLDPDFSRKPSTGETLYERAENESRQIVEDLPKLRTSAIPSMRYRFPTGLGESLDREELRRLRSEVETVLRHLEREPK